MGRAPCCEKVGLKRGRWTAEEDEMLVKYIAANGEGSWRSLPKNAGLLRCGKSCRLRWINYLRADLKRGNISKEEEETIIKLHVSMGNRWSLIANHLPGRTDNEIKNYWNSHLSRRFHSLQRIGVDGKPAVDLTKAAGKQRGGRTIRSAMKNSINIHRREKKQEKGAVIIATSSPVHSEEGSSMVLDSDHQLENRGTLKTSPRLVVDDGLWPTNDMEGGPPPSSEESVGWGSHEEREGGVMSSSEGGGAPVLNGGRDGNVWPLALKEGGALVGEEEVGSDGVERVVLDWELEGILETKLWDEGGEMWPLLWDSSTGYGELEIQRDGGWWWTP